MKTLIFYAGMLYEEHEGSWVYSSVPEGAYIRNWRGVWMHKHFGLNRLEGDDIPIELRTLALLLD